MSKEIQEPGLSLDVRHSKGVKRTKEGKEEIQLDIYENEDIWKHRLSDPGSQKATARRRRFGVKASILGLLYLLILAGIFMRYIFATLDNESLKTERDQLNTSLHQLNTSLHQLTEIIHQLNVSLITVQRSYINVSAERDELQAKYDDLRDRYQPLGMEGPRGAIGVNGQGLFRHREAVPF